MASAYLKCPFILFGNNSCNELFSLFIILFRASLRSGAILGEGECLINFRRSRKKRLFFRVFFFAFLSGPSKINKTLTLPQNSAATQASFVHRSLSIDKKFALVLV